MTSTRENSRGRVRGGLQGWGTGEDFQGWGTREDSRGGVPGRIPGVGYRGGH